MRKSTRLNIPRQNNKFKVLFVKSIVNTLSHSFDFGIASLSAVLKDKGYLVDLAIISDFSALHLLKLRIEESKPHIIAFSVYDPTFRSTLKISRYLRKHFPDLIQIMGGIHIIINPEELVAAKCIDAACIGEGEISLVDFIQRYQKQDGSHWYCPGFWTRKNGKIIKNPKVGLIKDINSLPFPDREVFGNQLLYSSNYDNIIRLEFLFTRGCAFNCTYCSNHALRLALGPAHYVRRYSPQYAIDWIIHDLAKYACTEIIIHDDTFTLDKKWVLEFLKLYKRIKIPFQCNLRILTFDKQLLIKMKNSGCVQINVGVESGDEAFRWKVMRRKMPNKAIIDTFEAAKEVGVKRLAFIMLGLPDETPDNFIKTIKLVAKISPEAYYLSIFHPYKGTDLYKYAKEKKYLSKIPSWDFLERLDTLLEMPNFSRLDIQYYYKNFESLVHHAKTSTNPISQIHRKCKFFLLSKPPSHRLFYFFQFIVVIDNSLFKQMLLLLENLKRYLSYKDYLLTIESHAGGDFED